MFTKNFALEIAKYGINVNAIAPGGIATEGSSLSSPLSKMSKEEIEKITAGFIAQIPLGRMGVPDDIAKVAMFLASSACRLHDRKSSCGGWWKTAYVNGEKYIRNSSELQIRSWKFHNPFLKISQISYSSTQYIMFIY